MIISWLSFPINISLFLYIRLYETLFMDQGYPFVWKSKKLKITRYLERISFFHLLY